MDYRLKSNKDFEKVFKKGKKIYSENLTLVFFNSGSLKAGFAVGKKHGGSVQRNRIKRLLRESFRSFTPDVKQNFFFVFIPKVSENYTLETFKKSMFCLLNKSGAFMDTKC